MKGKGHIKSSKGSKTSSHQGYSPDPNVSGTSKKSGGMTKNKSHPARAE